MGARDWLDSTNTAPCAPCRVGPSTTFNLPSSITPVFNPTVVYWDSWVIFREQTGRSLFPPPYNLSQTVSIYFQGSSLDPCFHFKGLWHECPRIVQATNTDLRQTHSAYTAQQDPIFPSSSTLPKAFHFPLPKRLWKTLLSFTDPSWRDDGLSPPAPPCCLQG